MVGRHHIASSLCKNKPIFSATQFAPITTNKISIEEQREFWEKNEVKLKRPMSPHLSIYKPQATSMLSLIHRASGIAMCLGVYIISYGIVAMPYDFPTAIELVRNMHLPGALIYSLKTCASFLIVYHYINGMRHMAWDLTWGFGLKELYRSGYTVLAISLMISAYIASL